MPKHMSAVAALLMLACPLAASAGSCSSESVREALPVRTGESVPLSTLLAPPPPAMTFSGTPLGVIGDGESSLDRVLLRRRLADCVVDAYANYKPRTEFDNTPYRFNMESGKKFSSEEFDAWMKSRGVRIAKGPAAPAEGTASETPSTSDATVSD